MENSKPMGINSSLVISAILLFVFTLAGGFFIGTKYQNRKNTFSPEQNAQPINTGLVFTPSPTEEVSNPNISLPTLSPTSTSHPMPTVKPLPTFIPKPTAVIDEVKLIRHLLANVEMYIGASNTAGALQFFTPPISEKAKAKLASIRTVDLPFRLTFWTFGVNDDSYLLSNKISGGYKIMMTEGRAEVTTYLYFELVRAGNDFLVDRYYHVGAVEGSNKEDLKYEGFDERKLQ